MATFKFDPELCRERGDIVAGDPAERKRDSIVLGHLAESGPRRKLSLDVTGEQVVAVLGKRGTGKSYTLGTLIEGFAAGSGESPIANLRTSRSALVLDIMDIFWTSAITLSPTGPCELVKQYEIMRRAATHRSNLR